MGRREPGYSSPATRADDPEADRLHHRRYSQLELEAFEWRARWEKLAGELRAAKTPWPALARYGLAHSKAQGPGGHGGRRGRSARERDEIASVYINMRTYPPPPAAPQPWQHFGRVTRLGELWQHMADGTPLPADFTFVADCPSPMGHAAALRNVANYLGIEKQSALALLRNIDAEREREGGERLPLPPKRKRPARSA